MMTLAAFECTMPVPGFWVHNIRMQNEDHNDVSGLRQQIERSSLNLALCLATAVEQSGHPGMYRQLERVQSLVAELEFLLGCASKKFSSENHTLPEREAVVVDVTVKKKQVQ